MNIRLMETQIRARTRSGPCRFECWDRDEMITACYCISWEYVRTMGPASTEPSDRFYQNAMGNIDRPVDEKGVSDILSDWTPSHVSDLEDVYNKALMPVMMRSSDDCHHPFYLKMGPNLDEHLVFSPPGCCQDGVPEQQIVSLEFLSYVDFLWRTRSRATMMLAGVFGSVCRSHCFNALINGDILSMRPDTFISMSEKILHHNGTPPSCSSGCGVSLDKDNRIVPGRFVDDIQHLIYHTKHGGVVEYLHYDPWNDSILQRLFESFKQDVHTNGQRLAHNNDDVAFTLVTVLLEVKATHQELRAFLLSKVGESGIVKNILSFASFSPMKGSEPLHVPLDLSDDVTIEYPAFYSYSCHRSVFISTIIHTFINFRHAFTTQVMLYGKWVASHYLRDSNRQLINAMRLPKHPVLLGTSDDAIYDNMYPRFQALNVVFNRSDLNAFPKFQTVCRDINDFVQVEMYLQDPAITEEPVFVDNEMDVQPRSHNIVEPFCWKCVKSLYQFLMFNNTNQLCRHVCVNLSLAGFESTRRRV